MRRQHLAAASFAFGLALGIHPGEARQFADVRAIVEFQRAVDSYAFLHRRVQRSLAEVTPESLAAAIQAARPAAPQSLFMPAAASAFRQALSHAVRGGCDAGDLAGAPRNAAVYGPAAGTRPLAPCAAAALPPLPEELDYRSAGGALVIVDSHAAMIVDILTAPLAAQDTRR